MLFLAGLALVGVMLAPARAQDPAADLLTRINDARLAQGLFPYVVNADLTAAARRHSEDMAATGQISHTGSDGSSSTQRILDAGYGAYEFGLVASENVFGGAGGAEAPFDVWMADEGARGNLLSEKYREVGVGVAGDAQGRTFWTLTVGAQPNVLPVLVNDGASVVDTLTVTLRLVPENVAPEGRGTAIGQPDAYRASTSSRFTGAEWQPWAAQVPFVLDQAPGAQTVYVQLRDAAGRTTLSQTDVTLTGPEADVTVTPTGTLVTATPGAPTSTLSATATATPTLTPTPTPTATASPSATPTPVPSATPSPAPTLTPTPPPPPTETASATGPSSAATPSPSPTSAPSTPTAVTPTATPSLPADLTVGDESESVPLASRLAPWALGLQAVALVLGVYLALRRPEGERREGGE